MRKYCLLGFLFIFCQLATDKLSAAQDGLLVLQREHTGTVLLERDVLGSVPGAVIVRPGDYLEQGDVFLVKESAAGSAKDLYIELVTDWIEPLALKAGMDEIRVATLVGTAEYSETGPGGSYKPIQVGATLKAGYAVRVAEKGCVGLDVGGRHAVCLIEGSECILERSTSATVENVTLKLDKGAVFSHVNALLKKENKVDFKVQTPYGVAAARGTDFVTVNYPGGTDVWIAEGEVELLSPQGDSVGRVSSEGGALGIIRYPVVQDPAARMQANSRTMGAAVNLIPSLNLRLNGIKDKLRAGETLTAEESAILGGTKRFHYLVKVKVSG